MDTLCKTIQNLRVVETDELVGGGDHGWPNGGRSGGQCFQRQAETAGNILAVDGDEKVLAAFKVEHENVVEVDGFGRELGHGALVHVNLQFHVAHVALREEAALGRDFQPLRTVGAASWNTRKERFLHTKHKTHQNHRKNENLKFNRKRDVQPIKTLGKTKIAHSTENRTFLLLIQTTLIGNWN